MLLPCLFFVGVATMYFVFLSLKCSPRSWANRSLHDLDEGRLYISICSSHNANLISNNPFLLVLQHVGTTVPGNSYVEKLFINQLIWNNFFFHRVRILFNWNHFPLGAGTKPKHIPVSHSCLIVSTRESNGTWLNKLKFGTCSWIRCTLRTPTTCTATYRGRRFPEISIGGCQVVFRSTSLKKCQTFWRLPEIAMNRLWMRLRKYLTTLRGKFKNGPVRPSEDKWLSPNRTPSSPYVRMDSSQWGCPNFHCAKAFRSWTCSCSVAKFAGPTYWIL